MKIVHLTHPETVEVVNIPARREAGPRELLLEPLCVGLSGRDALLYRNGAPASEGFRQPHIPASEFVARVVDVERGVDSTLKGNRVVVNPVSPCQKCPWCEEGDHYLCPYVRTLGVPPVYGALQQRLAWPAHLCTPVPREIPDHTAVLLVPLAYSLHILDLAELKLMERVAVVGCGHQGLLLIKALRAMGAGKIIAVDVQEYRRRAALAHGADHAVEPLAAQELVEHWPRRGVDAAIDVSNGPEAPRLAIALTRIGGRTILGGYPSDNRILFSAQEARRKELRLQFVRRPHDTYRRAVELVKSGRLGDLDSLVSHQFELDEINEAFQTLLRMKDEVIKAVIVMPPYHPREESPEMIYEAGKE